MTIYISGKMSGLPDMGRAKFMDAQIQLENEGFIVLNPACLPIGMDKEKYMPICLAMVDAADMIVVLDNWKDSPGAQIEVDYGIYQGKGICDFDTALYNARIERTFAQKQRMKEETDDEKGPGKETNQ